MKYSTYQTVDTMSGFSLVNSLQKLLIKITIKITAEIRLRTQQASDVEKKKVTIIGLYRFNTAIKIHYLKLTILRIEYI